MARHLNEVTLLGYLGADPEMKYTQGGTAMATVNLATTEKWRDKQTGQMQERTEWHRCVGWGIDAENMGKYLKKGALVLIKGQLQHRKWQDQNGADRYTTEIKVNFLSMCGGGGGQPQQAERGYAPPAQAGARPQANSQQSAPPSTPTSTPMPTNTDDDIPF